MMNTNKKVIQYKVAITDPVELFTGDIKSMVLDKLKQIFAGKCYAACFIIDVLEIVKMSDHVVSRHKQNASTVCSVQFTVNQFTLDKYQIIHGCVIKNIDKNNNVVAEGKHMAVYIKAHPALKTLRKGQTIVAINANTKYSLFSPIVSVNAIPFIPIKNNITSIVFKVKPHKTRELETYLTQLDSITKANMSLPNRKFFDDLMYPRKTPYSKTNQQTLMDVHDLINSGKKELLISFSDIVPRTQQAVVIHDEKKLDIDDILHSTLQKNNNANMVVSESFIPVMGNIINTLIKYEHTIKALCSVYTTDELRKENDNLWKIYSNYKY